MWVIRESTNEALESSEDGLDLFDDAVTEVVDLDSTEGEVSLHISSWHLKGNGVMSTGEFVSEVGDLSVSNKELLVAEKGSWLLEVHVDIEGGVGSLIEREVDFLEAGSLIGGSWVGFGQLGGEDWEEVKGLLVWNITGLSGSACVDRLIVGFGVLLRLNRLCDVLDVVSLGFVVC